MEVCSTDLLYHSVRGHFAAYRVVGLILWPQLDVHRCTYGTWDFRPEWHALFSLHLQQLLVKMQLGLSVQSFEQCMTSGKPLNHTKLHNIYLKTHTHAHKKKKESQKAFLIHLKHKKLKGQFQLPGKFAAFVIKSITRLCDLYIFSYSNLTWTSKPELWKQKNSLCTLLCFHFKASPEKGITRIWIFFILYPGIIVYVVFCGGLQARITVLMLERELVFSCGQVYMHSLWV